MNPDLYSLGLEKRDQINQELGGGIPTGSIVVIEGEYGAGKSAITQRFTYGFCETGQTVTYVSNEIELSDFVTQMHSLSYDVVEHILDQNLVFLHAELESGSFSGDGERKELLTRLMDADEMWNSDIIVIDTFCSILRNDPQFEALIRNNDERQAALEIISFFRDIVSSNRNIILTVDPTNVDQEVIGPFRAIADVYIILEMIEVGNDVRRQMSVKRFAGMGSQVGDTVGYSVRSDTGIVIESRSVA